MDLVLYLGRLQALVEARHHDQPLHNLWTRMLIKIQSRRMAITLVNKIIDHWDLSADEIIMCDQVA